ncbi:MAG: cytochrome C oxidase subunit IV family protein [Ignavibacteriaceae bacterium]|jgi:cytochrome c oxidase subunit 4|nr:cytochrome C oxidase subunit IV family protein [Ignavibacteriaceae bacterium]MCW8817312.1 cytochrome C oxidase subunit IV family protein [Ignavibacteriaceae bacterium]MCW8960457.1 cytochrome C oxidase subunit IV family protein [Ignavibacteriaceae bacterium]MCW9094236.1 cytochrome C oxidase subunit IV family protein [Ignavibacteriaceae bacterium]
MEKHDYYHEHSHGYGIYILVWLALLALTAITVTIAGMNIGRFTVATALIIASVKAYLVLTIFMHLRSESKAFRVFVFVALLFLIISFILLFTDYSFH